MLARAHCKNLVTPRVHCELGAVTIDALLSRLDLVRRTGSGRWVANCPAHESKSKASLAVRELDDGRVLLHCFGGCDVDEILSTLDLEFDALYPERRILDRAC